MNRAKAFSGIMQTLLLVSMLILAFDIQPVKASGIIYIRTDGSIEGTTDISTVDNVTYTFTDNIYDEIVVERDNIVVDGAGYTLQGTGSGTGIYLYGRSNVAIKNMEIKGFDIGIQVYSSSNNTISGNSITIIERYGIALSHSNCNIISGNNITAWWMDMAISQGSSNNIVSGNNLMGGWEHGIRFWDAGSNNSIIGNNIANSLRGIWVDSSNNTISGNNVTNNGCGIHVSDSSYYNSISGNVITANTKQGVWLDFQCSYNSVSGNNITNNEIGISLRQSTCNVLNGNIVTDNQCGIRIYSMSEYSPVWDTTIRHNTIKNNNIGIHLTYAKSSDIYHNNFTNNTQQAHIDTPRCGNSWDDGYPSGGNYWSDYIDVDLYSGPYQNETGSDGIGDTAYVIDDWNRDNYPLMYPSGAPPSPLYALTLSSSPIGVTFTVNGIPHTTPWTETAIQDTPASLLMPEIHTVGQARYYWDQWSDGNTSRSRTVTMTTNITLTAHYTGPYYQLTVASLPITGIQFTINGAPKTTPYTEWLLEVSYTLEMPESHDEYVWSHWLEDGDTNRIKTITLPDGTTYTAMYTVAPIGGTTIAVKSSYVSSWIASTLLITFIVFALSIYLKRNKSEE